MSALVASNFPCVVSEFCSKAYGIAFVSASVNLHFCCKTCGVAFDSASVDLHFSPAASLAVPRTFAACAGGLFKIFATCFQFGASNYTSTFTVPSLPIILFSISTPHNPHHISSMTFLVTQDSGLKTYHMAQFISIN